MADEASTTSERKPKPLASTLVADEPVRDQLSFLAEVVGKGIENEETLNYLREQGIESNDYVDVHLDLNASTASFVVTALNVLGFFAPEWTEQLNEIAQRISEQFDAQYEAVPQEVVERVDELLAKRFEEKYAEQMAAMFGMFEPDGFSDDDDPETTEGDDTILQ